MLFYTMYKHWDNIPDKNTNFMYSNYIAWWNNLTKYLVMVETNRIHIIGPLKVILRVLKMSLKYFGLKIHLFCLFY